MFPLMSHSSVAKVYILNLPYQLSPQLGDLLHDQMSYTNTLWLRYRHVLARAVVKAIPFITR